VISRRNVPCRKSPGGIFRGSPLGPTFLVRLTLYALLCALPAHSQSPQPSPSAQPADSPVPGSVHGTIVDPNGTAVAGAKVKLTRQDQLAGQEAQAGDDGVYSFANVAPGSFELSITAEGFATQSSSGVLHSGENVTVPLITLALATEITEVRVELSPIEIAQEQIKDEEKQRVLGFIPNSMSPTFQTPRR